MKDRHGGDWAGFQAEYGRPPLDFSMNISPNGVPPRVTEAARRALEAPPAYPDPYNRALREQLAACCRLNPEQIVCGCGAADLIWRIVQSQRPQTALLPVPTFTEYARALEAFDCRIRTWKMPQPAFTLTEDVLGRIRADTDIVFLCEPNNPTGKLTDPMLLQKIVARCCETGTLLIVDECFIDFVAEPQKHTLLSAVQKPTSRLIVLRAFTKTYAMAGLRLGYALCGDPKLAEQIREAGQPWPVSSAAAAAGAAALKETAYVEQLREQTTAERQNLEKKLRSCGFTVVSGEANYVLFHGDDPWLHERLRAAGMLIRDCSLIDGLGEGWYRVAVRRRHENEQLMQAIWRIREAAQKA